MLKSNPILFKDLLIWLSSKSGRFGIMFFLIIYFVLCLFVLIEYKQDTFFSEAWINLFRVVWVAQLVALSIVWIVKWLLSFAPEKENKTLQFLLITPITPTNVVLWKLWSIFLYLFVLICLSLPFLSLGLLLGWVSILDVFEYLLYSVSYASLSILLWMAISVISKKASQAILFFVWFAAFLLAWGIFFGVNVSYLNIGSDWFAEALWYAMFPIRVFADSLYYSYKPLQIFGVTIHYLVEHVVIFWSRIVILYRYVQKKIQQETNSAIIPFDYLSAGLSLVVFLLLWFAVHDSHFLRVYFWSLFVTIIYTYSETFTQKLAYKQPAIFLWVILLCTAVMYIALSWVFPLAFLSLTVVTVALVYWLHVMCLWLFKWQRVVSVLVHVFICVLIWYALPVLSTELLDLELHTLSEVIKAVVFQAKVFSTEYMNAYWMYQTITYQTYIVVYLALAAIAWIVWHFSIEKNLTTHSDDTED